MVLQTNKTHSISNQDFSKPKHYDAMTYFLGDQVAKRDKSHIIKHQQEVINVLPIRDSPEK